MFLARAWVLCRSFLNASSCCMVAVRAAGRLKGGERRSKLEVAGFGEEQPSATDDEVGDDAFLFISRLPWALL